MEPRLNELLERLEAPGKPGLALHASEFAELCETVRGMVGILTDRQNSALETVVNFLEAFYEEFQIHLEHNLEIEGTEAEWMLEELKELL